MSTKVYGQLQIRNYSHTAHAYAENGICFDIQPFPGYQPEKKGETHMSLAMSGFCPFGTIIASEGRSTLKKTKEIITDRYYKIIEVENRFVVSSTGDNNFAGHSLRDFVLSVYDTGGKTDDAETFLTDLIGYSRTLLMDCAFQLTPVDKPDEIWTGTGDNIQVCKKVLYPNALSDIGDDTAVDIAGKTKIGFPDKNSIVPVLKELFHKIKTELEITQGYSSVGELTKVVLLHDGVSETLYTEYCETLG